MKGKGSVAIETLSRVKVITDALYVPEIDQNLLSVGYLLEKGFKVHFENRSCVIKDAKGLEVFSFKMKGKSFSLDLMEKEQAAYQVSLRTTNLWHKRLGHYHHAAVFLMQKRELVQGLDPLEESISSCKALASRQGYPFHRRLGGPLESFNSYILTLEGLTKHHLWRQ